MSVNPLADDLNHVLANTAGIWDELREQRIFITGGTGFFGCWLLETFLWANDTLGLNASATVLTRNGGAFRKRVPHLALHPAVQLCDGDIRTFAYPDGAFSHVIHAATDSSSAPADPSAMFDTIVEGTRRTLGLAVRCGARRFLLTSSGAVYGPQPADVPRVSEGFSGGPDPTDARLAYAEGKRAAEMLCAVYADRHHLEPTIARCFAFVGPYLPLNVHFAVGNFIRDALAGGPIRIKGDGTPYRSYLYAADLAVWLWTILLRGRPLRPYNVGSSDALTVKELAELVARPFVPTLAVEIACSPVAGVPVARYVPDVARADSELGLRPIISLADGIRRTIAWHTRAGEFSQVAHP
jgi:nucleoside-diphosphate-sugar epimerase